VGEDCDVIQKVVIQVELVRFYATESYDVVAVAAWALQTKWVPLKGSRRGTVHSK
jgi:hypothetical protein